jgi:zinc/manganese transport system permease protein
VFAHAFVVYALIAGTLVALVAGPLSYLLVLRAQVFAADAMSHVAFTGALAALAAGVDARLGLVVAVLAAAAVLGGTGRAGRADDVAIGAVFALVLGLGALFLSVYSTRSSGSRGNAGIAVLFGSILGLDAGQTVTTALVAVVVLACVAVVARPVLFATLDPAVAAARGVPVRALGFVVVALAGLAVAQATQVVGALLALGLLAAPGAAARNVSARPGTAALVATTVAVTAVWGGLTTSYLVPAMPPSTAIVALCAGAFAASSLARRVQRMGRRRTSTTPGPTRFGTRRTRRTLHPDGDARRPVIGAAGHHGWSESGGGGI